MSKKAPCPSFWQIVQETKVFINKLLDKLPVSPLQGSHSHQNQYPPQLYHQQPLHQKIPHSSVVSHVNINTTSHSPLTPCDSAAESYDSIQETIGQYTSLWEVQLALGEIPGMFEGNILQACQPQNQLQSTQQPQPAYCQQDQRGRQTSFQHFTFPDFSSITPPSGTISIEDFSEQSLGYYSDYECDQEGFDENEDYFWSSFSPRRNGGITKSDLRHDRKDSGVFEHDDEGTIIQISPKSRNVESRSELSEWYGSDVDEFEYGNMTIEGRMLALRSHVMGENFLHEVGSLTLPLPSLLGTISSLS
ncbi:hypothetical protein BGX26_003876 [Mortierella sp. AD094]|nr:hypothetical protein BGX26_003876 [Mortierella sp. AD094]